MENQMCREKNSWYYYVPIGVIFLPRKDSRNVYAPHFYNFGVQTRLPISFSMYFDIIVCNFNFFYFYFYFFGFCRWDVRINQLDPLIVPNTISSLPVHNDKTEIQSLLITNHFFCYAYRIAGTQNHAIVWRCPINK